MGFFTTIAAGFNFLKPALQVVGGIVCQAGSALLERLGKTISDNSKIRILENDIAAEDEVIEMRDVKEAQHTAYINSLTKLKIPYETAEQMVDIIQNAASNASTITTTGNIQMEVLSYRADFELARNQSNYLPITAYSFKKDIIQKLDKYNYVLPIIIYTEIKNTSADSGVRLDAAVTTAFDNAWLKADSDRVMTNLQPLSIDNKNTIVDLQSITQEIFSTFTVGELKEKYPWLKNNENLDMMFANRFADGTAKDETTTRNPQNGIIFKETKREKPNWVPYSVFTTMLNGIQSRNAFSDKSILFTGYAIKPRDENSDGTSESTGKCSISVRSYLICLGIQNEQDTYKKMITDPTGIALDVPSTDGSSVETIIEPEDVQAFSARRYFTISQSETYPALLMQKDNAILFNIWEEEAKGAKTQADKEKLRRLLRNGIGIISPMASDTGFVIRE